MTHDPCVIAFDSIDRKILGELQSDGRLSNTDLASRVGLSASACHRRVRRLESTGVIAGYVMVLDASAIGRGLDVFVEITLVSQSVETLGRFEEGVRLSKFCGEKLDETEKKVTLLLKDTAGNVTEQPFEPTDE